MSSETHRQLYPEQYEHEACGRSYRRPDGYVGKVVRVVASRFGPLAIFEDFAESGRSWPLAKLEPVE